MAKFSETLIRYSPLIGQILGNIDDIRVTRNYNEARKEIENAEKKRQEYQKFLTYNQNCEA
jgi:multidrug resistance efflux pump